MDPGNWATDLEGGARFGYSLLWVLVASNLVALLLQTLASRLGIVTRLDLAQACRDEYPRAVSYVLWVLGEIAIVACDLAEVLGAAIGLNLLFHIPLLTGVLLTAADTLLILWFTRLGIRFIEAFVLALIAVIAVCFGFEIAFAHPDTTAILSGLLPRLDSKNLYIAVGIFGATVMPHNLYLHSALVQTRRIGNSISDKRQACRFNLVDSAVALNGALFVNAAILIMSAAVFFRRGIIVTEIQQAHQLLAPLLGTTLASVLFGLALLCSGQSSTLTGTMAGQIVMEGFLRFRMQPWLRRTITRFLAITPAALTIYFAGEQGSYRLLILSQVILSLQLPFVVIPLVHFTSSRKRMGSFANGPAVRSLAWLSAAVILALNIWLLRDKAVEWIESAPGHWRVWVRLGVAASGMAFGALLFLIVAWPRLRARWPGLPEPESQPVAVTVPVPGPPLKPPIQAQGVYSRILVPLDHSEADEEALQAALMLAKLHDAKILLLHVEEGVTSFLFGSLSSTAEIAEGQAYLSQVADSLREQKVEVEVAVRHGKSPAKEITAAVRELAPDLVVMASHGHRGWKDLVFGTTINAVRHRISVPLLIVGSGR
jgi:manganese transport protein